MMRRDRRITLGDDLREVSEWQHTRFVISDADIEIFDEDHETAKEISVVLSADELCELAELWKKCFGGENDDGKNRNTEGSVNA